MRNILRFLVFLLLLLLANIIAYVASEDYRFFLKKLKYREEVVYDTNQKVDDTDRISIIDSSTDQVYNNNTIQTTGTGFSFLDTLAGKDTHTSSGEILPAITPEQQSFIDLFESYNLKKLESQGNLFGLTAEYPDPYYEWYSEELSIYAFSTKNYTQVKKIFEVLAFELPYTLKETNSFADASFFINLNTGLDDGFVRIVLESEKNVFGLKIKKDSYNALKQIFNEAKIQ